jgi:glycerophosphoryl diester phosphodiesterase
VLYDGLAASINEAVSGFGTLQKLPENGRDSSTRSGQGFNETVTIPESKADERIVILQKLCESKTGRNELNEDCIVINDSFVAVFDGATNKNGATYQGKTGGQLAVQFLADYLSHDDFLNASNAIDGKTAVCRMQAALRRYASEHRFEEQGVRLTASGVIYSIARHQIWSVGDCQFMINGEAFSFPKKVDRILSEARALCIHMFMRSGYSEEALKEDDKGRGLILDELQMQHVLENQPGEYGYTVFSNLGELQTIVIKDVLPGSEVVLASDGYPVLYTTLEESEYHLREILRNDPLCYKEYKSTKGLSGENAYVDDRSYVRFYINE